MTPVAPVVVAAPAPGSPEAETAMAKKWIDANPAQIPPEFKGDGASFLESWKTLRGFATQVSQENADLKKGAAGDGVQEGEGEVAPVDGAPLPTALVIPDTAGDAESAAEAAAEGGNSAVNWTEVASTYVPGTGFPDSTKTGLSEAGVPADVIASFEAGQDALQRERLREAATLVGGEKQLAAITAAAAKLPAERREQLNAALASDGWETVLVGLQAEMTTGKTLKGEPNEIQTQQGDPATDRPWGDQREMITAMKNPLYKTSPEYRAEVQRRCNLNVVTKKTK